METEHDASAQPPTHRREEIARLIRQLGSWNASRRWAAVESLRQMGPDAIAPLLAAARSKSKTQIKGAILCFACLIGLLTLNDPIHADVTVKRIFAIASLILCAIPFERAADKHNHVNSALQGLTGLDKPQAIGPLLDALAYTGSGLRNVRTFAQKSLTDLLPRLNTGDLDGLSASQRECLYRELLGGQVKLKLAILTALAQTGDVRALPYVKRAVSLDLDVIAARTSCLEVLRHRAAQQRASQTLLRASAPDFPAELVRPVVAAPPNVPEQLLRVADHDQPG